jgi:hypothetical protein
MSGTGRPDFQAPTRLTPIAGDQPIGQGDASGTVRPSMYFVQLIQRLLSYIGQPTSGNVAGQTLSGQVGSLNIATTIIQNSPGPAAPSINARLSALEAASARPISPVPAMDDTNPALTITRPQIVTVSDADRVQLQAMLWFGV